MGVRVASCVQTCPLSNLNVAINLHIPDVMSYDLTCLDHGDGGATGGVGQT